MESLFVLLQSFHLFAGHGHCGTQRAKRGSDRNTHTCTQLKSNHGRKMGDQSNLSHYHLIILPNTIILDMDVFPYHTCTYGENPYCIPATSMYINETNTNFFWQPPKKKKKVLESFFFQKQDKKKKVFRWAKQRERENFEKGNILTKQTGGAARRNTLPHQHVLFHKGSKLSCSRRKTKVYRMKGKKRKRTGQDAPAYTSWGGGMNWGKVNELLQYNC